MEVLSASVSADDDARVHHLIHGWNGGGKGWSGVGKRWWSRIGSQTNSARVGCVCELGRRALAVLLALLLGGGQGLGVIVYP
jgi:hypothetical protein